MRWVSKTYCVKQRNLKQGHDWNYWTKNGKAHKRVRRRQTRESKSEKGSVAGEGRYDDVGGDGARVVAKQLERESTPTLGTGL